MRNIITIWKKELKDTIRDRKTLMAMIVMPMLLMPLLIVGMGKFAEYQIKKAEEQEVKITFINKDSAPLLVNFIQKQDRIKALKIEGDVEEFVKNKKIDAGIVIPQNFEEAIQNQQPVGIEIIKNSINEKSSNALARISTAISSYNNQILQERFAQQNINPNILSNISVTTKDVATEKEQGGFGLGFLLPLFIVMWSIVGGQYTAIDISAGEKERKTLEALLLTPAKRMDIVFGKFLAVASAALVSVVVALSSIYAVISIFGFSPTGQENIRIDFSIEPQALILLFIVSVLLVLVFSAAILSIAIYAKSFKEAQSYIGPSYLVVIMPIVLINIMPGFKPSLEFFLIPAVNAVLLFKEILISTYDVSHILVTIISLIFYSLIALFIATKIYSKEEVLFKD